MNTTQSTVSAETARQILVEAEQNGTTVENYLREIAQKSNGTLKKSSGVRQAKIKVDFTGKNKWLELHRQEHAGKWIVLDGERLVGSGDNPVSLVEKARAEGVVVPFVQFITDDSEPFMGGWL